MRICSVENCNSPVFGTDKNTNLGYCHFHQGKRTDNKPRQYIKKETMIKDLGFGFDNQLEMFLTLWSNAKDEKCRVFCPYTHEQLNYFHGKNNFFSCFAHILPKGRYPYFKLNPENIAIVHPNFHRIIDQGTHKERLLHPGWNWSAWDEKVAEMKAKYAQFKKDNLLP